MSWGAALFGLAVFLTRKQIFDPGCKGQIRKFTGQIPNHGFFLLPIQIAPVHRCVPRLHSTTEMREPIFDRIGRLVVGSIQL